MAAKRLARYVTVDGATYGPDDDVPADVAEQITNPAAWMSDEDAEVAAAKAEAKANPGTSAGRRLAGYVTIDGTTYGPDDKLSDEVAESITNPAAWEGGKLPNFAKRGAQPKTENPDGAREGAGPGDADEGAPAKTEDAGAATESRPRKAAPAAKRA